MSYFFETAEEGRKQPGIRPPARPSLALLHPALERLRRRLPTERLLIFTFLLTMVAAAGITVATYFVQQDVVAATAHVERLRDRRRAAVELHTALDEAEIAERDYLLSRKRGTLDRYRSTMDALTIRLQAMDSVADDPRDAAAIRADAQLLVRHVALRIDELQRSVEAHDQTFIDGDTDALIAADFDRLTTTIDARRDRSVARTQRYGNHVRRAIVGLSLAVPLALGLACWLVLAELRSRRAAARRDAHAARHDALTGLPNRALLLEWAGHALANARREAVFPALIYLDLDGFKAINDSRGHRAGDHVLREVARRLGSTARRGDMVARLGGDEFVVLTPRARGASELRCLAQRLIDSLAAPIEFEGRALRVGASAGIALAGPDTPSPEALIAVADGAMYRAKRAGKGRVLD